MQLHQYQQTALDFLRSRPSAALWLDPGLGKTAIALSLAMEMRVKTLVIAPLRPCYVVWPAEIEKWHFPLSYNICHGTPLQRLKCLNTGADVTIINFENVAWLSRILNRGDKSWGLTIVDEQTGFKNWSAMRSRAFRNMKAYLGKIVGLTGTPAPNGLTDLYSQIWQLDEGRALGSNVTVFRNRYCERCGYKDYSWRVRADRRQAMQDAITHLVLRMDCKDYLDMPKLCHNKILIRLAPDQQRTYDGLERKLLMALESGTLLLADEAKYTACRGYANGGLYEWDDDHQERMTHEVHGLKVSALQELIEELAGKPLLVAYTYQHDEARLRSAFPGAPFIGRGCKDIAATVDAWNAGRIPVLFFNPQSMAHGVNMQEGGADLCWFSLTDQPELHAQANARVWRQGQTSAVRIHYLLMDRTVDMAVMARIEGKAEGQDALLTSIQNYVKNKVLPSSGYVDRILAEGDKT